MKRVILIFIIGLMFSCSKTFLKSSSKGKYIFHSDTLQFSGCLWVIRDSHKRKQGPGTNLWQSNNAYVDKQGFLHLKITKKGNNWYCAEVTSTKKFGYGSYQWYVESKFNTLDKNVILGLFNYSGIDGRDEMDIELGRWGKEKFDNTSYTIYPAQDAKDTSNWNKTFNTMLTDGENLTTQRFTWKSNYAVFLQELRGFHDDNSNQIDSITCYNPPHSISNLPMQVHMNLWLFESPSPSNNIPAEIIIHNFKFTAQ